MVYARVLEIRMATFRANRREVDVAACAMPMQKIETVDEPRQRAAAKGHPRVRAKAPAGPRRQSRVSWCLSPAKRQRPLVRAVSRIGTVAHFGNDRNPGGARGVDGGRLLQMDAPDRDYRRGAQAREKL